MKSVVKSAGISQRVASGLSAAGAVIVVTLLFAPLCVIAEPPQQQERTRFESSEQQPTSRSADTKSSRKERHSFLHGLVMYIPNRVLDVLDIFRARVRVGPGFGLSVRATEPLSAYVGSYASVYAGLPGPRNGSLFKLPAGIETLTGVQASMADLAVDGGLGPDYSLTEVGIGAQIAVVGFDLGIDPLEVVDFAVGIIGLDLRDDDL